MDRAHGSHTYFPPRLSHKQNNPKPSEHTTSRIHATQTQHSSLQSLLARTHVIIIIYGPAIPGPLPSDLLLEDAHDLHAAIVIGRIRRVEGAIGRLPYEELQRVRARPKQPGGVHMRVARLAMDRDDDIANP